MEIEKKSRKKKNDGLYPLQCVLVYLTKYIPRKKNREKVRKKNKRIANAIVMQF